jgi:hypothetical protein
MKYELSALIYKLLFAAGSVAANCRLPSSAVYIPAETLDCIVTKYCIGKGKTAFRFELDETARILISKNKLQVSVRIPETRRMRTIELNFKNGNVTQMRSPFRLMYFKSIKLLHTELWSCLTLTSEQYKPGVRWFVDLAQSKVNYIERNTRSYGSKVTTQCEWSV